MCKKVGEIKGIIQYELCADYRYVRAKQREWIQRLEDAQYYSKYWNKKVKEMQKIHCPINVKNYSGIIDYIRVCNPNATKEDLCFGCSDNGTERCNTESCKVGDGDNITKQNKITTPLASPR